MALLHSCTMFYVINMHKYFLVDDAEAMLERLLREHQNETEALRASQQRNRDKQMRKLQDRLEENREQWSQRKEAERMEQEQLRQYEDNVVKYVYFMNIIFFVSSALMLMKKLVCTL